MFGERAHTHNEREHTHNIETERTHTMFGERAHTHNTLRGKRGREREPRYLERERAHSHTHHIFFRERAHTQY